MTTRKTIKALEILSEWNVECMTEFLIPVNDWPQMNALLEKIAGLFGSNQRILEREIKNLKNLKCNCKVKKSKPS